MILGDLFESRMSDLDIEYQDYKNLEPVAFYSRYKMTKDEWASKNWSLIKGSETIHEGVMKDLYTELADKYRELAPKIEKYKDSYLAGELYDALEEIAARHGAMKEFRSMLNGARNRAHMDYDTNPGGFQNWFWYLPFADDINEEDNANNLSVGDPVIIQGTEYDGKTGDIKEFSPSGKFVVVDLYNYGPQAFHLSNVEYNQYADELDEEKRRLDPKCWKGKKIGNPKTKMKGGVRVNNCVPIEEEQLDELKFLGSECTKDCSGHRAGYNWSKRRGGVDGMSPWSPSFNKGAALAKAGK